MTDHRFAGCFVLLAVACFAAPCRLAGAEPAPVAAGIVVDYYRSEKPLRFFCAIGIFLALISVGVATPVVVTYLEEGIVPRLPTAVLSMGLMIVAMLSVSSGLVLDTVTRGRREMKLLAYLSQAPLNRN